MEKSTSNIRYFLYVRRSQDAEDRQVASLEDQREEMSRIAKRLGLTVVRVFEESRSAKRPGRPVFNDMLERIRAGEADGILCWRVNRLARNAVDGGQIIDRLQQAEIAHIQTNDRGYWPTDNLVMLYIEFGMANQFSIDLGGDVGRGTRRKAARGWNPQSWLPPGYRHNKDYKENPGQPEILSTPALTKVSRLLRYFLEGSQSAADTHRQAKALGLRNKKGRPYSYNTIRNILVNPMYMGWFWWRDEDGQPQLRRGKHEAIISEQQHRRILLLLGEQGWTEKKKAYDFAFRGPLSCGECGSPMTAEQKLQCICTKCKHKFSCKTATACPRCGQAIAEMDNPSFVDKTYYRCTKTRKDKKCSQKYVEELALHKAIAKIVSNLEMDNHYFKWADMALRTVHKEEIDEQHQVAKDLTKKHQSLLERIDSLVIMRADGELSADQFRLQKEKTEIELAEIERERQRLDQRALHWAEIAHGYLTFAQTACDVFNHTDDLEVKREILQTLGSNLEIFDQKPRFTMVKPILALKKMHVLTNVELGMFEPEKVLAGQGFSKEKTTAFSVLCTGMKDVRTAILETKECFLPAYCRQTLKVEGQLQ